jgi:hypothetical protein
MTNLITKNFRTHLAEQFIESFTEAANNIYYLAIGKHTPYANNDQAITTPYDTTTDTVVNPYEQIIFGKKIAPSDVSIMTKRYNWTAGTVYSKYDDTASNLFDSKFYVVVDSGSFYYVYKVLDNNGNTASTVQPSNTSESACNFITTSDGYKWKLMYRMSESSFEKFATTDYMPVVTSANVAGNTVAGALDSIVITAPGANYFSSLQGTFTSEDLRDSIPTTSGNNVTYRLNANASSNSDFYVGSVLYLESGTGAGQIKKIVNYTANNRVVVVNSAFSTAPSTDTVYRVAPAINISGDGTDASGFCEVSSNATVSNFISSAKIVNRGSNYTYATAIISGNTGGYSSNASLRIIIPPKSGHGYNAKSELGATAVGVSVKLSNSENGFVTTENDFRTTYLIRDPRFQDVTFTLEDVQGSFASTEKIYQVDYKYLRGSVELSSSNTSIVGSLTEFEEAFRVGDRIIVNDSILALSFICTVSSITNNEFLTVTSAPTFSTLNGTVAYAFVTAEGTRTGNSLPYLTASSVEPKFVVGRRIIGEVTGAWANVTAISVTGKNYNNWNTFDNRTRISYTSNTGTIAEDTLVFQQSLGLSNAFFHSSNATYITLTSEKGVINADPSDPLISSTSNAQTYILGSIKYSPDIVKGSGEIIYIENRQAVSRSNSQTETIRTILNF